MAGRATPLARHCLGGVVNSALPFLLYMAAALVLSAGLMSVFNATAPIWGALIAWLWLGDRLTAWRVMGLAIGVAGVVGLTWGKADFRVSEQGISPALGIAACLGATFFYGLAANVSRRYLRGCPRWLQPAAACWRARCCWRCRLCGRGQR